MKYRIDSREDWLNAAIAELRPIFKVRGYDLPAQIRVSVGFPIGRRAGGERLGRCWAVLNPREGGGHEIFVSPMLDNATRVLGALTHDLCHLAVGMQHGHRAAFAKCAAAMGLEAPWIATSESEAFRAGVCRPVLAAIGSDYPHVRLAAGDAHTGPKKQQTRLIRVVCPSCGYNVRTTMKWILSSGTPLCPTPGCDAGAMEADI